jgi:hypothetical protein
LILSGVILDCSATISKILSFNVTEALLNISSIILGLAPVAVTFISIFPLIGLTSTVSFTLTPPPPTTPPFPVETLSAVLFLPNIKSLSIVGSLVATTPVFARAGDVFLVGILSESKNLKRESICFEKGILPPATSLAAFLKSAKRLPPVLVI